MLLLFIGFVIGVIVAAMAIEIGFKQPKEPDRLARLSYTWSISEISNPKIVAEYLLEMDIPSDARLVFKECKDKKKLVEEEIQMRQNETISANFIVGDNRALILSGPIKNGEMGVWTIDPVIIKKLQGEFERLWAGGKKEE